MSASAGAGAGLLDATGKSFEDVMEAMQLSARAPTPPRKPVDLTVVRNMLQRLIEQRPSKDSDQFRHVFRLFGRPKFGITPDIFKRQIHTRLGIILTDEEALKLFRQFDYERKGTITLQELIERILPADYTRPAWNIERDKEADRKMEESAKNFKPYQDKLPASLAKKMWTLEEFIEQLQTKIIERTSRPSDQFREAYIVFGKPESGLTRSEFREMIFRLGIVVSESQMDTIFHHFDTDGNGVLSFAELCKRVIPKDYSEKTWAIKADERAMAEQAKRLAKFDTVERDWPAALAAQKPTLNKLKEMLADKILERTKRANDQYREAFQLFGSPQDGIGESDFKSRMRLLGIVASDKQIHALFKSLDENGNGFISFEELVDRIMPKDYTGDTWVQHAERRVERDQVIREAEFAPVLHDWPKSLSHARLTEEAIIELIRKKIIERTKRPEDQYREAFKLFGSPHHGITKEELGFALSRLGMVLAPFELDYLFKRFDDNGNGILEFQEFVQQVMPPDYPGVSWYIKADLKATRKMARTKKKMLDESPFFGGGGARPDSRPVLTPIPPEILAEGRRELEREARATRKRRSKRRKGKGRRGEGDLVMPLSTGRASLHSARPSARGAGARSSSTPKLPRVPSVDLMKISHRG